jgi:hypothetical protein
MSARAPATLTRAVSRTGRLRGLARRLLGTYLVAWSFLAAYLVATIIGAVLPAHDRSAVAGWASTSVANLEQHPIGSLFLSAFISGEAVWVWPLLIALAVFGANRAVGHLRFLVVIAAGHVIGTLVSEGIVAYRVDAGLLPVSDRHILDVGPSYVVVSAIVLALAFGSWPARAAAAVDLALLVFAGRIFSGLGQMEVAAVGHATAIAVAACAALLIARVWPPGRPDGRRPRDPLA